MEEEEILTEQENIRQVYDTKKTDIIAKKGRGNIRCHKGKIKKLLPGT